MLGEQAPACGGHGEKQQRQEDDRQGDALADAWCPGNYTLPLPNKASTIALSAQSLRGVRPLAVMITLAGDWALFVCVWVCGRRRAPACLPLGLS